MDSKIVDLVQSNLDCQLNLHLLLRKLKSNLEYKNPVLPLPQTNYPYPANFLGSTFRNEYNPFLIPTLPKQIERLPLNLHPAFHHIYSNAPTFPPVIPSSDFCFQETKAHSTETVELEERDMMESDDPLFGFQEKEEDHEKFQPMSHTRRKFWLPAEDAQLIELVNQYGEKWSKIASVMQGRTGKQIRDRYINSLKPGIRQDAWTPMEDELLIRLYKKIGNKWSKIANYLKGRTENQVKNRFRTYFKKINKSLIRNMGPESSFADGKRPAEYESDIEGNPYLQMSRSFHMSEDEFSAFTQPRKKLHVDENDLQQSKRVLDHFNTFSFLQKVNEGDLEEDSKEEHGLTTDDSKSSENSVGPSEEICLNPIKEETSSSSIKTEDKVKTEYEY